MGQSPKVGNSYKAKQWELLTIRGRGPVTLVVGNDVAAVIAEDAYTAVGRSQIDTNRGSHFGCMCGNLNENENRRNSRFLRSSEHLLAVSGTR